MKILQEILNLTIPERLSMGEKIWDSIDHDKIAIPDSHQHELDRRLERYEKGETTFASWDDIRAELRSAR